MTLKLVSRPIFDLPRPELCAHPRNPVGRAAQQRKRGSDHFACEIPLAFVLHNRLPYLPK